MLKRIMLRVLCFFIAVNILVFSNFTYVWGLSAEQKKLYDQNILYYDLEEGCVDTQASAGGGSGATVGGGVFFDGDSLGVGMKDSGGLEGKLKKKGFDDVVIDSAGSRSMITPGDSSTNGIETIEKNSDAIEKSDTVIIELGTNSSGGSAAFKSQMKQAIDKVRDINENANIYWVKIFSSVSYKNSYNNVMDDVASSEHINLITINPSSGDFGSDGIHLTASGYDKASSELVSGLKASSSGGGSSGGGSISGNTTGPPKAVQQVVWDTLISGGIDAVHTAAAMGNINQEGAWQPMSAGYFPNNIMTKDPSVSQATDGYGLIGWTPGTRLLDSMNEAGINGKPYTAETQAAVILAHIKGKTPSQYPQEIGRYFLSTKNIDDATEAFQGTSEHRGFENPADMTGSLDERKNAAKRFLKQFGDRTASTAPSGSSSGGNNCACKSSGGSNSSSGGSTTLSGDTNAEKIFNYLMDNAGLTDKQAAGAVGSMMLESGGNTLNIDPTAENPSSHAYGIAQWLGSRKTGLDKFASENNGDISDLTIQVQYLVQEMEGDINGFVLSDFKKTKTLAEASKYWTDWFEGLVNSPSQQLHDQRIKNGELVMSKSDGGGATTVGGAPAVTDDCGCTVSGGQTSGKTVVIDPGHGPTKTTIDKVTGLTMQESDNQPEGHDAWEVSNKIKEDLSKEGYNIILTKNSEDDNVTFRQRAEVADKNNAALALSIHGDPGLASPGEIYVQKVGLYRGSGANKTEFKDSAVAKKSQEYAKIFQKERGKTSGGSVVVKDNSFDGRAGLEPGNIPMVQLFSKTPWIYNEKKMSFDINEYAKELENSIKAALDSGGAESTDSNGSGCSGSTGTGDLSSTVLEYAWPEYSSSKLDPKPEYKAAYDKAVKSGQYGGGGYTDCGAFVTRAMIDSGFEPKYNSSGKGGNTISQMEWLSDNWEKINVGSTKDLELGDVAISTSHTYMYVGELPDFDGNSASASLNGRVPMASDYYGGFDWYRKK